MVFNPFEGVIFTPGTVIFKTALSSGNKKQVTVAPDDSVIFVIWNNDALGICLPSYAFIDNNVILNPWTCAGMHQLLNRNAQLFSFPNALTGCDTTLSGKSKLQNIEIYANVSALL